MLNRFKKTGKCFIFSIGGGRIVEKDDSYFLEDDAEESFIANFADYYGSRKGMRKKVDLTPLIYYGEIEEFTFLDSKRYFIFYVDKNDYWIRKSKLIEIEEDEPEEIEEAIEKSFDAIEGDGDPEWRNM